MVDCPGGGSKFGCPVAQWAHWDKPARACSEMAISSSKQSKERSAGCWDPPQGIRLLLGRSIPGCVEREAAPGPAGKGEARRRGGKSVRVEQRRVNGKGKEGKRKEGKAEPGEGRGEGDEAALRTSHGAPGGILRPRRGTWRGGVGAARGAERGEGRSRGEKQRGESSVPRPGRF